MMLQTCEHPGCKTRTLGSLCSSTSRRWSRRFPRGRPYPRASAGSPAGATCSIPGAGGRGELLPARAVSLGGGPSRARGQLVALVAGALLLGAPGAGATTTAGPAATIGPTVIGTAAAGKRLTGPERGLDGLRRDRLPLPVVPLQRGRGACLSIHGATSPTYTLVAKDIGKTVGLTVSRPTRPGPLSPTRASSARSRPHARRSSRRCSPS